MALKVVIYTGGGAGDVLWEYLHDQKFTWLKCLKEDYNAKIRVTTICHCPVDDLFVGNPLVDDYRALPWQPPSEEANRYVSQPDEDGYLPITRLDLLQLAGVTNIWMSRPQIHISDAETRFVMETVANRPAIVCQPYAGLSDRDGFDVAALRRLADDLANLNSNASLILIGKNHERGHKYAPEIGIDDHPNVTNLIDKIGLRVAWHLVNNCDAYCGAHSNFILTAWEAGKRSACVVPDPLMTRHWQNLDPKYTVGLRQDNCRVFTYPFDHGQPREFDKLDTAGLARFLLRGE